MFWLTARYLTVIINRSTLFEDPDVGINMFSQSRKPAGWWVRVQILHTKKQQVGCCDGSGSKLNWFWSLNRRMPACSLKLWQTVEIRLEAIIVRVWRLKLCEIGHPNWTSIEIYYEVMIVSRLMPWSSQFGQILRSGWWTRYWDPNHLSSLS